MTEPVFFARPALMSIAEVVALTGAEPSPDADLSRMISGIAPLDQARPDHVSFFDNARFARDLMHTRAGACFCLKRYFANVPDTTVALVTPNPRLAFAQVANRLYPEAVRPVPISGEPGVSAAAHIHPGAAIESDVTVEPFAVVGPGAEIGRGSHIGPGSVIGPGVRVGRDVIVEANVTITHALLGNRVILHPGVRIGQDGFGYVPGAAGHLKIAQIARVIIQDDVEIGANTAIDRGATRDTIIGEGSKIDNQVQIAHNVVIGRHCLIAGQVGISGSVTIGDFVMIGGNAGIRDNVSVGNGARVAAMSGIHTDIPAGETWAGVPAQPIKGFQRQLRALRRLETRSAPAGREGGSSDE